ncbi:glycosyltransferase family 2 protein [Flavobacterium sp.]|uniref:glycosyltransferase family 2 protein n=1 Tax=Flavobacterium sp. TaxID=239 RepID=UPI002FDB3994
MFDIAVILINYNSSDLSIDCIKSIYEKTSSEINFQVIITDNNSEKKDYENLKNFCNNSFLPNLKLVKNNRNSGFGGGNMHGFKHSNAKYLAFVNNDTLFINDCLTILKKELDNNLSIGIAGAQAYKEDNKFLISLDHFASPAREIFGRNFLELINPKKYPKRKKRYISPIQVNFIPGSFMFVKTEDFIKVGGFDDNIFLYYEETDLCLRLAKINKFAYLIPQAEFIHFHGASTEKSLAIKKELKISLLYVMKKHYGHIGYQSVRWFLLFKYGLSSIVKAKNRPLFSLIWRGAPLNESLQFKQN